MSPFKLLLATACIGFPCTAAVAQQASSSAYGAGANVTANAGNVVAGNVTVAPVAPTSGSAPPTYNNSNSVASVSQSGSVTSGGLTLNQSLGTGIVMDTASGTATGAQATSTINNLQLSATESGLLVSNLLGLSATTIQSSSQASSAGGLSASGSTTIEGLTLAGALLGSGVTIDGSLFANPAPNTILLSIGGLTITLNEQTMLGDGFNSLGISTNAIDIAFNNFLFGSDLLNGNIIVGHSEALASLGQSNGAVPEPATWAMMLIGFAAIGVATRRRKAAQALALA